MPCSRQEARSARDPYLQCPVCYARLVAEEGVLTSGFYRGKCKSCNQEVKFWSVPSPVSEIMFSVNGTQYTISNPDPSMSLNGWLRSQPGLKGTKVMCHEAGCGCCVVAVTREDVTTSKPVTLSVNSCLFPLCAANGATITTVEGLGNRFDGFHPIQERLAEHNGSQCGYCSPGFVMNMYSLLKENPALSKQQIEDSFDGNICRCTGYRPILDAMKTFAKSSNTSDIEEITKCRGVCQKGTCPVKCAMLPGEQCSVTWYSPTSLSDLYALMSKHSKDKVRLVGGNTGKGIYKNDGPFDVMIEINKVKELHSIKTEEKNADMTIGAAVSLNAFTNVLDSKASLSQGYKVLADHVRKVANVPVRNVGTIGGNLMLTHDHPDFPSDIFTILEGVGARLVIGDSSSGSSSQYSLMQFLNLDMTGQVIVALLLPVISSDSIICTYKVMPRAQNSHAYVNAGFAATLDKNTMIVNNVRIVYGGIGPYGMHASKTETFLNGKKLTDESTLKGALAILSKEMVPDSTPVSASKQYRKSLALGLFYKFYLTALGDKASARVKSAAEPFVRPVSSGTQSYDSQPKEYPLTQPMTKLASKLQTSGEAQFVSDIPTQSGEIHAAFVISTQGNCLLDTLDPSEALKMPGVVGFIKAGDIPKGGVNNFMPASIYDKEKIFSSGPVLYAGQALGLILADSAHRAFEAAMAVKVTYKNQGPVILTIDEAVAAKSFFDPQAQTLTKGDPDAAIKSSPHKVQGEINIGTQYHFHMETQIALCVPEEDGITVHSATQGIDYVQSVVAQTLNIPMQSVNVSVKRCGGAYGARISRANHIAAACAVAAYVTKRPVRLWLSLGTNMEMVGLREPYKATYTVGVASDGKLNGIDMSLYCDCGSSVNEVDVGLVQAFVDNAYFCENWKIVPYAVKTHTAGNTWCRSPASTQAVFFIETVMEHIAKSMNKTPEEVRYANLYQKGQKTQMDQPLKYCSISSLWNDLLTSSDFHKRREAIENFNSKNRWRKRGISVVPLKYGVDWDSSQLNATVSIFHTDGTIAIAHGGIEIGQGINTKVAQVAAYALKCPLDAIAIKPTSAMTNPNCASTGASITSELCCKAVLECCNILNKVIDPVRKAMPSASWADVIAKCYTNGVDLSARYMYLPPTGNPFNYNSYGVTCLEAEIDVLTGERQIIRTDILFDCGESMNPELDVGQVEGAFVMGLGLWLTEKVIRDPRTGRNLTHGTWEYKPPSSKDIPIDFRISLLKNAPNPSGILRSKVVGEPPLCMSSASLFAVKHAVQGARAEIKHDQEYFPLDAPAMVEDTQLACLVDPSQFTL